MMRAAVVALGLVSVSIGQELNTILPRGAQRGTELDVSFVGSSLENPVKVLMERTGIQVLEIEGVKSNRVRVRVRIAADCSLGAHPMILVTKQGITRTKSLQIGTMREVGEISKTHRDIDTAQPIDLEVSIGGRASGSDEDWYRFEVAQGHELTFEVEAVRMGQRGFDPFLELRDHQGKILAEVDDCWFGHLDPVLTYTFAAEGAYFVVVRDSGYRGGSDAHYRLHVGSFPRPLGTLPCGGARSKPFEVAWVGAEGGETITIPKSTLIYYEYFATRDGRTAPTPNLVRATGLRVHLGGTEQKVPLEVPFAIDGCIDNKRGSVRFRFAAKKGQDLNFNGMARRLNSPVDMMLVVRDKKGKNLVSNDDRFGSDSVLRFKVPADGEYLLDVYDVLRRHGDEMFFRVEVHKIGKSVMTTRVSVTGQLAEDFGLAVPRGGRIATMIAASSLDRKAGVRLGLSGLPEGVKVTSAEFRAGADLVPILLEAAEDTPLGGELTKVVASTEKDPVPRSARFSHLLPLVRVDNNVVYVGRTTWRVPVAVTDRCPFDVVIVQPTVPVIRGSGLVMDVKIIRREGFKGTVYAKLLWNPPGISSGTISIAGSKSSGRLSVNSRSSAAIQTWKLNLIAWTKIGQVTRKISSKFFNLEVSPPWIEASIGKVRGEQGQKLALEVQFTKKRDFVGECKAELLRLPKGIVTEFPMIGAGTEKIVFDIDVDVKAPPGRHRSHYLRLQVPSPGGPVTHIFRGGEVRIDRPLPSRLKKKAKPTPKGVQGGGER